ncbi:MAG: alginate export family protein [Nitrospina sp.]|nr:alginate export family protein [Nitrospina sp.]
MAKHKLNTVKVFLLYFSFFLSNHPSVSSSAETKEDLLTFVSETEKLIVLKADDKKSVPWVERINFSGSLWEYFIYQKNNYFGTTQDRWLESVGRLGMEMGLTDQLSVQLQGTGQAINGDADNYDLILKDKLEFELDLANITYKNISGAPLSITLGRQDLKFGDGFLIYDGYYDTVALWLTPITSFNAAKLNFSPGPFSFDLFYAETIVDSQNFEAVLVDGVGFSGDRSLWGLNSNLKTKDLGEWDLGIFIVDDKSAIDSDTAALSLRGTYQTQTNPTFTLTGEIVSEFGTTNAKNHSLSTTSQYREAVGGHIDGTLSFNEVAFSPYLKARYSHFPGDDPTTDVNEAFDPLFFKNDEFGTWGAGDINSYNLSNTNERVVMAEVGLYPTDTTMFRAQHYFFWLEKEVTAGAGKKWSEELNLIFDWYPNDTFFAGAEFGWARPLKAAKDLFGNRNTTEFVTWAGVQF